MQRKKRKEFTLEERQYIHKMLNDDKSFEQIGKILGRDVKVLKRVVSRYEPKNPFTKEALSNSPYDRAKYEHDEHKKRLKAPKDRIRLGSLERQRYVEEKIKKASPELIAGRYKLENPGETMCHESIYQWIYNDRPDLVQHLELVSQRGRRKRNSNKNYRFKTPAAPKTSIEQRPAVVDTRERFGDFERDSVMGIKGTSACIQNIAERKSRVVFLTKLSACNAEQASAATNRRLSKLPDELRNSMTEDNGPENSLFAQEEIDLNMPHFFCHPYCAPERGTVEVLNRYAVRRFYKKGTDFTSVTFEQIEQAEAAHNNRPMKCLGFKTPLEVFSAELEKYNISSQEIGLRFVSW